jgi:hypothetical protein
LVGELLKLRVVKLWCNAEWCHWLFSDIYYIIMLQSFFDDQLKVYSCSIPA